MMGSKFIDQKARAVMPRMREAIVAPDSELNANLSVFVSSIHFETAKSAAALLKIKPVAKSPFSKRYISVQEAAGQGWAL